MTCSAEAETETEVEVEVEEMFADQVQLICVT